MRLCKVGAAAILALFLATSSHAQPAEKPDSVAERFKDLPADVITILEEAEQAGKAKNFALAAGLFEKAIEKAPQKGELKWAYASCLVLAGQATQGCTVADQIPQEQRSLRGLLGLLGVLDEAGAAKAAAAKYRSEALNLARAAAQVERSDPLPLLVLAQFSLQDQNLAEFRRAVGLLNERFPDACETHFFSGLRAAMDEDWRAADRELHLAADLGFPREEVDRILAESGIGRRAATWRYAFYTLYTTIGWLIGFVVLFVAGKTLSAATLGSIRRSDPNRGASAAERLLRRIYRMLINVAGLYYYVSWPLVIFLSFVIPAAILYGMFMLPRISVKLVAIVAILGLISIWAALCGLRACFVRIKHEDPGKPVRPEDAPALWETVREVADKVDTRPVDEIWLTPGADMAVYEHGGFLARLRGGSRRALIVGAAAIDGLSQNAFRAVLAHEYGHFRHGDTAGGDVALRVNNAMAKFAETLVKQQSADWWNVSYQFLRGYHFLFRRITFGATRLQEVLADRVAASAYGPKAFEEGLRHVVRRSIEFQVLFSRTIDEGARTGELPENFYRQPVCIEAGDREDVEKAIGEVVARPTTEDDTHPGPTERFALLERLEVLESPGRGGSVWELFADPDAMQRAMSDEVLKSAKENVEGLTESHNSLISDATQVLDSTPTAAVYEYRGMARAGRGLYAEAIADFTEALGLDPKHTSALARRAWAYKEMGDYGRAAGDLETLLQQPDLEDRPGFLRLLAECHLATGRCKDAIEALSLVLKEKEDSATAYFDRGRAYRQVGRPEEAAADLSKAIELCPRCAQAWYERGLVREMQGRTAEAKADFAKAVEAEPGWDEPRMRLQAMA